MRRTIFRTLMLSAFAIHLPYLTAHAETSIPTPNQVVQDIEPQSGVKNAHAVSLHGEPKYAQDFKHLDYVNPDAPKGGTLKQHVIGTYDSLNPFIVKGVPASGMNYIRSGLVYESLMQNAWDEPFTLYGVIAKDITIADDKSWVRFTLRDEAKWHDGTPITADDVIWTFKTLTEKGQPFFKAYWHDVEEIKSEHPKDVTFKFTVKGNAELPLIIAEMSILPKHYWSKEEHDFEATSLGAPLGSGPYKVGKVDAGRSIEYVRNPDWWGKDLPFFKGMYNFDRIVFDYYRDENVAHEAFLSGDYDVKQENKAKTWHEEYQVSEEKSSRLIKEELEHKRPAGMQAFIYNIRRPVFQDIQVREALSYAYDFEWSNKQFAYGDYVRGQSYYDNSELASSVSLPSEAELQILTPVKDRIPARVFTEVYKAPQTDGSGQARHNLRHAKKLLEQAGYTQLNDKGVRYKTLEDGAVQELKFEILHYSATFERWVLPFIKNLKRLGVEASFRIVDTAQFQNRINTFDYDILIGGFGQSGSPGNEQRDFWGSDKADINGSRNLIGIKDPVIDDMISGIIHATSREDLVTKVRAMDRVLLWNHYVIPMWHYPKWRIARWDHLAHPDTLSDISPLISYTWWSKNAETQQ